MLHDACQIAVHPLLVLVTFSILVFHTDALGTGHTLMDTRKRQTALFHGFRLTIVKLKDMRIDVHLPEILVFGQVFREHIQINHSHADVKTDLRSCQSHALAGCQRFKHVGNQFVKLGIILGDIHRLLPEYWLTIYINR